MKSLRIIFAILLIATTLVACDTTTNTPRTALPNPVMTSQPAPASTPAAPAPGGEPGYPAPTAYPAPNNAYPAPTNAP